MKLTITLSPNEETNMRAWAAWLAANPNAIGKPTGNWNNGSPDYQSKIVLEDQTRQRYDEIAAQFNVPPPLSIPTNPTHVGMNQPLPWFSSQSGQVNVTIADVAGRASCSDKSGGADDWLSTNPAFPLIEGITSRGAGSSGFVAVTAGQAFYFKQNSGGAENMRASIE